MKNYLFLLMKFIWIHVSSCFFWNLSQSPNDAKYMEKNVVQLIPYLLALWRESWVWEAEALILQSSHWSKDIAMKEVVIRQLGIYIWALGSTGEVKGADGSDFPGMLIQTTFSLPREVIWSMRLEEWVGIC